MEKIATRLAGLLRERQIIDDSMYDIYHYGMLRMLEIGTAFFSSLLICLSMGMIKEGLIFFAFFIPLRSYLGGVHLKKFWQCYIASCLILFLTLIMVKAVVIDLKFIGIMTVFGMAGTVFEAFADYRKQKINKVYFLIICTVLSLLILLAGLFYIKEDASMIFLLCCTILLVFGSKMIEQFGRRH